jgi:hypothetical protein
VVARRDDHPPRRQESEAKPDAPQELGGERTELAPAGTERIETPVGVIACRRYTAPGGGTSQCINDEVTPLGVVDWTGPPGMHMRLTKRGHASVARR